MLHEDRWLPKNVDERDFFLSYSVLILLLIPTGLMRSISLNLARHATCFFMRRTMCHCLRKAALMSSSN
jgi:hypothetical protein